MSNSYTVVIKTNFWNFSRTVTAPSKEAAIAQGMVIALHENHSVPTIKVKEASASEGPNKDTLKVKMTDEIRESIQFNQVY